MTRQAVGWRDDAPGRSRYPGPRPFRDSAEDRARFFGRSEEGEQLYLRVLSVPVVLHFGSSGVGKTSLLQAWLFPRLREKSFLPVMVRLNVPTETVTSAVARGLRQACEAEGLDYVEGDTGGLWELLSTTIVWRDDLLLTPLLVFDQFEEVFTIRDASCRADIAAELGAVMSGVAPARVQKAGATSSNARPSVKVVITVRENYLGELEQFSAALPGLFHERVRLEPLAEEDARKAITGPAQLLERPGEEPYWAPPFTFEASALESMLAYLRGSSGAVQPIELQLLCRYAEDVAHAKANGGGPITLTHIDLKGPRAFDDFIKKFYRKTVQRLPARQRRRTRRLCERGLLGVSGLRLMLEEAQIRDAFGVNAKSLEMLVQQRLIRREFRLHSTFYEISHDRLADTIFQARKRPLPVWVKGSVVALLFVVLYSIYSQLQAEQRLNETEELLTNTLFTSRDTLLPMRNGGIDLLEELTRVSLKFLDRQPATPRVQRLRSVAFTTMGDVYRQRENTDEALNWYKQALQIDEQLLAQEPSNRLTSKDLMVDYYRLSMTQIDVGDLVGALATHANARELAVGLEQAGDPAAERARVFEQLNYGDRLLDHSPTEALRWYLGGLAIIERLAAQDQQDRNVRALLAATHRRLGDAVVKAGQPGAGLASLQKALPLSESLATAEPANAEWQNGFSWHLVLIGRAHFALRQPELAQKTLERAVAVMKPVVERESDLEYMDTYAQALLMIGRTVEAAPVVAELRSKGWTDPTFLDLCQKSGL